MLSYNARYYDPVLGRFISADTIVPGSGPLTVAPNDAVAARSWVAGGAGPANPQDLNRYSYGLNNPVRNTDPTGHCTQGIQGVFDGSCLRKAVAIWNSPDKTLEQNLISSSYIGLSAVALVYGGLGGGKLVYAAGSALAATFGAAEVAGAGGTGTALLNGASKSEARDAIRAGLQGVSEGQTSTESARCPKQRKSRQLFNDVPG